MGHINFTIQKGPHTRLYILSDAAYMGGTWLARVDENDSKIIRQFSCNKFRDSFRELKLFIDTLGEVKQMSAAGIPEGDVALLEDILIRADGILPVNGTKSNESNLFWDWLKTDKYMLL